MPTGANKIISEELTAHLFTLLRVSAGLRTQALSHIESLFDELQTQTAKYAKLDTTKSAKFAALEQETGRIIKAAYSAIGDDQTDALARIAVNEGTFSAGVMNKAIGVDIFGKSSQIDPRTLEQIARGRVLEGNPLSSWWQGQGARLRQDFTKQVSNGILLGESTSQMANRVAGLLTGPNPTPGLKKKAQAQATALVRTSVMAVTNSARIASFEAMGTVKGIQWLATLDGRTTPICIALDKKQWRFPDYEPIGHNKKFPGPIAHVQCRSTQTAVTFSWEELSGKKLPALNKKTLQEAIEAKMEATGSTPKQIAGAVAHARASMDGPVSEASDFQEWATSKGPDFVAKVIGPGRQELFNAGKITFNDLTDQNNRPLSIAQLEHASATGQIPPETLGLSFFAYQPSQRLKAQTVQDAADAARKESEAQAAEAETAAKKLVAQIVGEQTQAYGGPYTDAKAALERMQAEATAAEIKATYDKVTDQSAPSWLKAWRDGLASPHTPDARPNRLRAEAWDKYAKGEAETAETWRKLAAGWKADQGGGNVTRAMQEATAAMDTANQRLAEIRTAVIGGDKKKIEAALLDAQGALVDAQSKLADALEAQAP